MTVLTIWGNRWQSCYRCSMHVNVSLVPSTRFIWRGVAHDSIGQRLRSISKLNETICGWSKRSPRDNHLWWVSLNIIVKLIILFCYFLVLMCLISLLVMWLVITLVTSCAFWRGALWDCYKMLQELRRVFLKPRRIENGKLFGIIQKIL